VNLNQNCSNGVPGYNKTTTCPCEVNSDCPSCNDALGCGWCDTPSLTSGRNCQTARSACANGTSANETCHGYCSSKGSDCTSCLNTDGCGWCSKTGKCVDSAFTGGCLLSHTCLNCGLNKYCDPCNDIPGCTWCEDNGGKCQSQQDKCNFASHTCLEICHVFDSCDSCNKYPGCGWCNGNCLDTDTEQCSGLWQHGCLAPTPISTKCGFDGSAFVGGMFLVIGIIVLGVLAYIVYRWRSGKKILYTELR